MGGRDAGDPCPMRFDLALHPWAQERPRFRVVQPKRGEPFVHTYDAPKSREWKAAAERLLADAMRGIPLIEGPLEVQIVAIFECPKSAHRKTKPTPRRWLTSPRFDWDNVGKIVCDAMQGVVFKNDGQIVRGQVERIVAAQGEAPGVIVLVTRPSPLPMFLARGQGGLL